MTSPQSSLSQREAPKDRFAAIAGILRVIGALSVATLLAGLYHRVSDVGTAAIYAATWITLIHICFGEYVMIRYLHAGSSVQRLLDLLVLCLLAGAVLSFTSTSLWCSFFGGAFALAVVKYLLLLLRLPPGAPLTWYIQEKLLWAIPITIGFIFWAMVLDRIAPDGIVRSSVEIGMLTTTTLFAIWMIAIRRIYWRMSTSQPHGKHEKRSGPLEF